MKIISSNRKARFDYEILETFEAGIELRGFEVKAVKNGRINISGSYAAMRGGEIWLLNADIPPYQPANTPADYDSQRSRRLLLHHSELQSLAGRLQEKGLTLVPLEVYIKRRRVKIKLGLGKSRKKFDKRQIIRKREDEKKMRNTFNSA